MIEKNGSDFKEIVRKIENEDILLPDFQREFKWKDEDKQKGVVCSVLSRMPIGSILLLQSKSDEYACKRIGSKLDATISDSDKVIDFLLDGQQRLTVLANVFSNVIYEQTEKLTDLISQQGLKKRFFLRIPKWINIDKENDLFGLKRFSFPIQNPDSEDPTFLTGDIKPFIECLNFTANDKTPYNPNSNLSTDLDTFCLSNETGYLIPLFLLCPTGDDANLIGDRFEIIIEDIAKKIKDEISLSYGALKTDAEKKSFLNEIFDESKIDKIILDSNKLNTELDSKSRSWARNIKSYLNTCISQARLNQITVTETNRARAIDIYENLNRGGVSLNTFDLIMAKVAKESKQNFFKRLVNNIKISKKYNLDVVPEKMVNIITTFINSHNGYNASYQVGAYDSNKNEISTKYTDAFLNVAALCSYNKDFDFNAAKNDHMKRDCILNLDSAYINNQCENICNALDRAFFFFQTRCGIRTINEINYTLMLTLVATIFMNDDWFNDKKVHNLLESWYWCSIFSGEFDSDQNPQTIKNLKLITNYLLRKNTNLSWLDDLRNSVLNTNNFSDKALLLMEKTAYDRIPKIPLRHFICQYFLSKTYTDMFDENLTVNVFSEVSDKLEAHHIIPLGSQKKVGEITDELRGDDKNICNSPLNFVYITKQSNITISSDDLPDYARKITNQAKSDLKIPSEFSEAKLDEYIKANKTENEKLGFVKEFLSNRFDAIQGDIKSHTKALIG